jgi:tripartite-type tricarboxylate transporter receptor subunit TctC
MIHRRHVVIAAASSAVLPHIASWAQSYPSRPIQLVVPFGAGSTADIISRLIGVTVSAELGQSVVIQNRPGAGGTLGAALVARAPADGYTLVLGTVGSHGVGTLLMDSVSYDPVKSFQAITMVATAPSVIVVHHSIPATNLKELVEYVKAHPGLDYASAGTGTTTHLSGEALAMRAHISLTHVPYAAVGKAITDLLGGQIKMMIYPVPALKDHIEAGTLRLIAATSRKRISLLPDLPTVAETYPDFDYSIWFGVLAPANTDKTIVETLHRAILKAMDTAEMKKQFASQALEPVGMGPDAFQDFISTDLARWKTLLTGLGKTVR